MKLRKEYVQEFEDGIINRYYVYVHRRTSDNSIYYVGKGSSGRAWSRHGRNTHWKNIYEKHGRIVDIVFDTLSLEEAHQLEINTILELRYFGHNLCNIHKGGEQSKDEIRRYTAISYGKRDNKVYTFANLDTLQVVTGSRKYICDETNLTPKNFSSFLSKGAKCWQRKRWVLIPDNTSPSDYLDFVRQMGSHTNAGRLNSNKDISTFQNLLSGEIFTGTRRDLSKKYNLNLTYLASLFTKRIAKSCQGWAIMKETNDN